MIAPEVSVVMSVYNGAHNLKKTIDSILQQEQVNFEFIIINDGCTDSSSDILQQYASKDARIILMTQENQGLTVALAKGCGRAKGKYIARQDVGDLSASNRLNKQVALLTAHPNASFVSCSTRFIGPQGEFLYDVINTTTELRQGLQSIDLKLFFGPSHHGSVMFKRNLYEKVGGYRTEFRVAQDVDLWLRLIEKGNVLSLPDILYFADVTPGTISSTHRQLQLKTAKLIIDCAKCRRLGKNEASLLKKVSQLKYKKNKQNCFQSVETYYFIGMLLSKNNNNECKQYFKKALSKCPLHIKSLFRLISHTIKG